MLHVLSDRSRFPVDHHFWLFLAFCAGQLAIFGIGVPWLQASTGMSWGDAIHNGFTLFIVGGLIKALAGAAITPMAWRAVKKLDA